MTPGPTPARKEESPTGITQPDGSCPSDLPERIGRFEIRRLVGEGAFGRVYEAFDLSLKRVVALKVAKPEQLGSPERVKRFQREARAAANLAHPHIVGVFDSGQEGPHHYIATTFVAGRSLQAILAEQPPGQALAPRRAAELARALAEALAYAHRSGVIHRDVKPSNVLINDKGEPLLADFGLAARADEEERLTRGNALGTPAFTSPEQWRGEATAASDQYGLGCLLYEMLTGRLPFSGRDDAHLMYLHLNQSAPPLTRLNPAIPRDLETVCLKCLEKDPQRRYGDCQALADDLRCWLEGEPIRARPVGIVERAARWARKNPAVAGLTAAVFFVLAVGVAVASVMARVAWHHAKRADAEAQLAEANEGTAREKEKLAAASERTAREKEKLARENEKLAEARQRQANEQRDRAEWLGYAGKLALAQKEWQDNNAGVALNLLEECQWNLRGWEHRHLWSLYKSNQRTLKGHEGGVTSMAWSPDGGHILSGGYLGNLKVWDAEKGKEVLSIQGHSEEVTSVAWSPEGRRILSSSWDKTLKVWDAQTGEEKLSLKGHTREILSVAWSPDVAVHSVKAVFPRWGESANKREWKRSSNSRKMSALGGSKPSGWSI